MRPQTAAIGSMTVSLKSIHASIWFRIGWHLMLCSLVILDFVMAPCIFYIEHMEGGQAFFTKTHSKNGWLGKDPASSDEKDNCV